MSPRSAYNDPIEAVVAEMQMLTPQQVGVILQMSARTVQRHFRHLPGVVVFQGERETIRIPRPVLDKWIADNSGGFVVKAGKRRI